MALLNVQVVLDADSALPRDRIVNNFHFDDAAGTQTDWDNIVGVLTDFYDSIKGMYSAWMGSGGRIKAYRLSDPQPRQPVFDEPYVWPSGPPSGDALPLEVAAVLSFRSFAASGTPQARRRGRVYIGPLAQTMIATDGRLNATALSLLNNAGDNLMSVNSIPDAVRWSTWSTVDLVGAEVVGGFVDNEPDTQRRRGRRATTRSTFPI